MKQLKDFFQAIVFVAIVLAVAVFIIAAAADGHIIIAILLMVAVIFYIFGEGVEKNKWLDDRYNK